jgi:hypothetical protein
MFNAISPLHSEDHHHIPTHPPKKKNQEWWVGRKKGKGFLDLMVGNIFPPENIRD